MQISQWLKAAEARLTEAGVPSARLDTLVLLEDFTGKDRSWLLAHPEFELKNTKELDEQIERRSKHEPLAYIRGKSEFYGRDFMVSADTLEPRPETETIIDLLKGLGEIHLLADIGTGSGCLAITAQLELPNVTVYATELNKAALKIAQKNATTLDSRVKFSHGDLLQPLVEKNILPDTIITNLPYVPDSHTINQAAMFEPGMAIFGGPDGLDLYRTLFQQIQHSNNSRDRAKHYNDTGVRYVLTESLPFQHTDLTQIAKTAGYQLKTSQDFIQVFERA